MGEQSDRQFALVYDILDREKETNKPTDPDKIKNVQTDPHSEVEILHETSSESGEPAKLINDQGSNTPLSSENKSGDDRKQKICTFYKNQ